MMVLHLVRVVGAPARLTTRAWLLPGRGVLAKGAASLRRLTHVTPEQGQGVHHWVQAQAGAQPPEQHVMCRYTTALVLCDYAWQDPDLSPENGIYVQSRRGMLRWASWHSQLAASC